MKSLSLPCPLAPVILKAWSVDPGGLSFSEGLQGQARLLGNTEGFLLSSSVGICPDGEQAVVGGRDCPGPPPYACDDSRALSLKDVLREGLPGGQ